MGNCKTCKHWAGFEDHLFGQVRGAGICKAIPQVWDISAWDAEGDLREILPQYKDTKAFVRDGSDYRAELQTLPDFGCVMHEPLEIKEDNGYN